MRATINNKGGGKMKSWLAVVSLGVVAGLGGSAVADDDHGRHDSQKRVFRTSLSGYSEVPSSLSTTANGQFYALVHPSGTGFTYWLTYSGFVTDVAQAHIHFGQHHTNGGISVWLCQGTVRVPATLPSHVRDETPNCQNGATTMPITATITADDVVGPAGQGIALEEFAELLAAMRAGVAYANVHSAAFPGGEIRGQVR
jgi:hypothetical protein